MMTRLFPIVFAFVLASAGSLEAQQRSGVAAGRSDAPGPASAGLSPLQVDSTSVAPEVFAGVLAGAGGLVLGGLFGFAAENALRCDAHGDFCGLSGMVVGALLGESLALPLGVHLAAGRQGSYPRAALVSVGVGILGASLALPTGGLSIMLVPLVQLGVSLRFEHRDPDP